MAEAESRAREKDRERAHLLGQLGEQNQRLTGELEAATRREEELTRQLEELRVQFQDKRETMRDHVMHLETLKDGERSENTVERYCVIPIFGS